LYSAPGSTPGMKSSQTPPGSSLLIGWTRPSQRLNSPMTLTPVAFGAQTANDDARDAVDHADVRAEVLVDPLVLAVAEEPQVELRHGGLEAVRVLDVKRLALLRFEQERVAEPAGLVGTAPSKRPSSRIFAIGIRSPVSDTTVTARRRRARRARSCPRGDGGCPRIAWGHACGARTAGRAPPRAGPELGGGRGARARGASGASWGVVLNRSVDRRQALSGSLRSGWADRPRAAPSARIGSDTNVRSWSA
jgi:hypothetical protein